MVEALRQRVRIGAGGTIEIRSAELLPGSEAEVIVLAEQAEVPRPSDGLSQFIGSAKGVYTDAADADRCIRSERESWEN